MPNHYHHLRPWLRASSRSSCWPALAVRHTVGSLPPFARESRDFVHLGGQQDTLCAKLIRLLDYTIMGQPEVGR